MELSIVICSYNREQFLPDALNSVALQDLDKNRFELVMINNNSTDSTDSICKKFGVEHPELNYTYAIEREQGLSSARNKGIEVSKGRYIAFIDDDAIAYPDYASKILEAFKKYPQYDSLGGKVLPIYPRDKEPEWMSHYIQGVVSKVDYGDQYMDFKQKYPAGCNMVFKREIFKELGGFNTDLTLRNDDKFMFLKLRRNKKTVLYAADVIVNHNIDAYRMEYSFIHRLSKLIGSTERVRLKNEAFWQLLVKPLEYLFKFGAALLLGLMFLLKGQHAKAHYIILIRWLVIIGYFSKVK